MHSHTISSLESPEWVGRQLTPSKTNGKGEGEGRDLPASFWSRSQQITRYCLSYSLEVVGGGPCPHTHHERGTRVTLPRSSCAARTLFQSQMGIYQVRYMEKHLRTRVPHFALCITGTGCCWHSKWMKLENRIFSFSFCS